MYKPKLGLKSSIERKQFKSRLSKHPEVFELHLTAEDVYDNFELIDERVEKLVKLCGNENVIIHHPFLTRYKELVQLDVSVNDIQFPDIMYINETLIVLAKKYNVRLLMHPMYFETDDNDVYSNRHMIHPEYNITIEDLIFARMDYYQAIGGDNVMFENSISTMFNFTDEDLVNRLIKGNYNLVFDVSHAFISALGNNKVLINNLKKLKPFIKHYHIVDSKGASHDSLQLGKGFINWEDVLNNMNPKATMIYETYEIPLTSINQAIDSHKLLSEVYNNSKK